MCIVAPSGNFCREAAIARASCPIGAVVPLGPTVREPCGLSRQPSEICTLPPCSHLQRARARERERPVVGGPRAILGCLRIHATLGRLETETGCGSISLLLEIPPIVRPWPERATEGRGARGARRAGRGDGERGSDSDALATRQPQVERAYVYPPQNFDSDVMSSVFHSEVPPSTARRRSLVRSGFEFDFAPVAARAFLLELPWLACSTWFNGCARTVQWKQCGSTRRAAPDLNPHARVHRSRAARSRQDALHHRPPP